MPYLLPVVLSTKWDIHPAYEVVLSDWIFNIVSNVLFIIFLAMSYSIYFNSTKTGYDAIKNPVAAIEDNDLSVNRSCVKP